MKKLMIFVAAIAMISGSAYAADWNFYGSARVSTFWTDTEAISPPSVDSDEQFEEGLQSNARIGANVKVSDELTGRFEYGASGGNANIRILWGEWNFGGGSLGVGQHYTPLNYFYSNQVFDGDADLLPYGGVYSGRQAMIQLTFGGLQLAFVEPNSSTAIVGATTETTIPTIEANYNMKFDNISVNVGGGYNTFEVTTGGLDYDVDAYVLTLGAKADFGAFSLGGNVYFGENAGQIIAVDTAGDRGWADGRAGGIVNNQIDDADNLGFIIVAGFNMNDMLSFEAGYGYAEAELDSATEADEVSSYYLNATVTLAPGVFIVPEIGMIDGEEATQAEVTYFGAKWQINF